MNKNEILNRKSEKYSLLVSYRQMLLLNVYIASNIYILLNCYIVGCLI